MYKKLLIINLISFILFIHLAYSRDSIIYADYISTDTNENVIIKGNVRIVNGDELLKTEKLYIDETKDKIIVEEKFIFMDESENFYHGSSGIFSKNFNEGEIQDFGFVGSESLRMVGTKAIKKGNVDIINKGVVTPLEL